MSTNNTNHHVTTDDELQCLVDNLRLSCSSPGDEQIDTLAHLIQNKLNLKHMNQNSYREMAKQMLSLSVTNNNNTTTATAPSPTRTHPNQLFNNNFSSMSIGNSSNERMNHTSSSTTFQSPQQPPIPKSSSPFFKSFGGSTSSPQQPHPRRGRSPARSTLYSSVTAEEDSATTTTSSRVEGILMRTLNETVVPGTWYQVQLELF